MTILRWILVGGLAFAFLLLSVANWVPVPFRLPDGAMISVPLPVLLAIAFLTGWLPTWLYYLGSKATWKRRLGKQSPTSSATPVTSPPLTSPPPAIPPHGI